VIATVKRLLLVAACVTVIPACGGGDPKFEGREASEKSIACEVLRCKKRADGKFFIDFLVSDSASKEEVLKLAESLRQQYDGKFACISIFDSREAWRRHEDLSYPEKELDRHWLVVIDGDSGQKISWVAEGRQNAADTAAENRERAETAKKAKVEAERLREERAKEAVETLKQAKQSVEEGKAAKAEDRHEEASIHFQQAVTGCEKIIKIAAQTPAFAEAKGLLAESTKLLAEEKAEVEGAHKLALPKRLVQDGQREKSKGNIREANALFERAKLRLQEIIRTHPKTKAAAEAEELLDKLD
jgi:hypothetical protein